MNAQTRGTVVSHLSRHEAERAAGHPSDQGIPVDKVAIAAQDPWKRGRTHSGVAPPEQYGQPGH